MNILVVGNIITDVYLNLDDRATNFETDKHGIPWLNLSFDASENYYFNRTASLGGAAVTLEVLEKLGLTAKISGSNLEISTDGPTDHPSTETYRYILLANGNVAYLAPTHRQLTTFTTPDDFYDYIYIDRSANITPEVANQIASYLNISHNTKLVLYLTSTNDSTLAPLIDQANLVFFESPRLNYPIDESNHSTIDPSKLIHLSDISLSYQNVSEPISIERINTFTHLSTYSILSATILGCFILGRPIEESFKIARLNAENAKVNASLPLDRLQELFDSSTTSSDELALTAANLVLPKKGILAADESGGSIHKKFEQLNIEDTFTNRRDYRNVLITAPNLERYVNGVILFDETARQFTDDGQTFVDYLTSHRIIPGIKVDQGLVPFEGSEETYTKGLDDLTPRLEEYYKMGLRFAKWRAAFNIRLDESNQILTPSEHAITENCRILAEYAKKCQSAGIVPIVEPEVVYDGYYSIDQNAEVTSKILDTLFAKLSEYDVSLPACILKTNMVLPGKQLDPDASPDIIGMRTAEVLKQHVPADLAGIAFLSGGQTPEQATANLAAVIKNGPFPWPVTFSFARALQDPALFTWQGDNANTKAAQAAFTERLIANTDALSA